MKYEVSKKAIQEAKKCTNNFECLEGRFENCPCVLERYLEGNGVFLHENSKLKRHCEYILSYGYSFSCHCPVRIEIFKKYKV
ncbi:MAG: hypothetical protein HY809_09870 [Nitrospirae bacterium]|nr:hypothetical protein [Nitrospirota bacterium]